MGRNKNLKNGKIIGMLLAIQLFFILSILTESHATFQEVVLPDDNTVIVYVYRLRSMLGAMVSWNVRLDGNMETSLKQNRYTVLFTTPGKHSITIGDSEAEFLIGGMIGGALGVMEMSAAQKKGALPDDQPSDSSDGSVNRVYYFRSKGSEVKYVSRDQALREMARLTYQPSSSSKGREIVTSTGAQTSQETGNEIEELLKGLRSDDSATKRQAVVSVARSYGQNSMLLEAVEEELLKGYNEHVKDKYHVDAIAWMCKVLSASGDVRYRKSLATVTDNATNRKIKKYAKKALDQLN
jgi:hypothetical protein